MKRNSTGGSDLEVAIGLLQNQIDEIAAEIISLNRAKLTSARRDRLLSLLLCYQAAGAQMVAAGYQIASGPVCDDPRKGE